MGSAAPQLCLDLSLKPLSAPLSASSKQLSDTQSYVGQLNVHLLPRRIPVG